MVQANPNSRVARRKLRQALKATEKADPGKQGKVSYSTEPKHTGLLVTGELSKAVADCKARVEEIAQDCRLRNRKFRDIEFDLEFDRNRCLHGCGAMMFIPSDVQRVTQLFEKPAFFIDGADCSDIQQGVLGDCWFLSALSTLSTADGLIDKFCVARDEQVGVYGFIFFRDTTWVNVIIDDLLFTSIPKFEELSLSERMLYHNDKELYNKSARKTGKSLLFARSGTHGETWVPLVEKAFAKLHGNFAALSGGEAGEAVEDLTGGVNTFISTKDILDEDRFWKEELLQANIDRLFGCAFDNLDSTRSGVENITVNGLIGGHAYSVLRAVEYNGKRFVIIRNPWGKSEWTGNWSDGSKEWTSEWLPALEKIGHTFGDDGEFVMEYRDFLENWEQIDRIRLFDESWVMSSQWLEVTVRPFPAAWSFGDVSFTIEVPAETSAIIVLSQLDDRYYKPLASRVLWSFDFVVYKRGETKPICYSAPTRPYSRSVNAEVKLKEGEYVVHVRTDRTIFSAPVSMEEVIASAQPRNVSRVLTEAAKSSIIASNADRDENAPYLPIPLSILAGQDISQLEEKAKAAAEALKKEKEALEGDSKESEEEGDKEEDKKGDKLAKVVKASEPTEADGGETEKKHEEDEKKEKGATERAGERDSDSSSDSSSDSDSDDEDGKPPGSQVGDQTLVADATGWVDEKLDDDDNELNEITLGLRVYTSKDAPANISGQLRREMQISFDGLAISAADT